MKITRGFAVIRRRDGAIVALLDTKREARTLASQDTKLHREPHGVEPYISCAVEPEPPSPTDW